MSFGKPASFSVSTTRRRRSKARTLRLLNVEFSLRVESAHIAALRLRGRQSALHASLVLSAADVSGADSEGTP